MSIKKKYRKEIIMEILDFNKYKSEFDYNIYSWNIKKINIIIFKFKLLLV